LFDKSSLNETPYKSEPKNYSIYLELKSQLGNMTLLHKGFGCSNGEGLYYLAKGERGFHIKEPI